MVLGLVGEELREAFWRHSLPGLSPLSPKQFSSGPNCTLQRHMAKAAASSKLDNHPKKWLKNYWSFATHTCPLESHSRPQADYQCITPATLLLPQRSTVRRGDSGRCIEKAKMCSPHFSVTFPSKAVLYWRHWSTLLCLCELRSGESTNSQF